MAIHLDHIMVQSHNKVAAATLLATLLGVSWGDAEVGPFTAVYVNEGLTLDFDETDEPFPLGHYCFRVEQDEFDAILERIKASGITYRSTPNGSIDMKINTRLEGNIVYWSEPDGHVWEMLTVSYARQVK